MRERERASEIEKENDTKLNKLLRKIFHRSAQYETNEKKNENKSNKKIKTKNTQTMTQKAKINFNY